MRDYLQLFYSKDSNPWLPTVVTQYYFFGTKAQCDTFVAANPVSPGGGTLSSAAPIWFRLNKADTLGYINNANVTNIGDGGVPVLDGAGNQMIYLDGSPRSLGINSKIEKKGATTKPLLSKLGFLGAQYIVTDLGQRFIDALLALAGKFLAAGDARSAGIVQGVAAAIVSGHMSITEANAFLLKAGIIT